jgi:mitogen-activated protein kinase 15
MTVEDALQHHLMDDFRGTEPEIIYPTKIEIELSENCKLDRRKYRDILYKMDLNYQKTQ